MSQIQWLHRQRHWREVTWQRELSDHALEARAKELVEVRDAHAAKQNWDAAQDASNALFIVRDEQRRRQRT